ncbi:MAG: hypothetical protein ACLFQU_04105 [Candidatus Kapaibacterium sp.]
MKKLIIIIFAALLLPAQEILTESNRTLLDEIIETANLEHDEKLVIVFINPGECVNCYLKTYMAIECLLEKSKKIKFMGAVKCDRDIELKAFKRTNSWEFPYMRDKKIREAFGIDRDNNLAVINYSGRYLGGFKFLEDDLCDKILKCK